MTIFIFGNPDLKIDSMPLKILPELQKKFPEIDFKILDPNEDWKIPEDFIVIDTVLEIKKITVFDGLKKFIPAPNISMHDFDAYANLRYLEKLGKLKKIQIIGVPAEIDEKVALNSLSELIKKYI